MDELAAGIAAFVGGGLGAGLAGAIVRRVKPRLPLPFVPAAEHEHSYTVMRADAKGWRCGICDKPKVECG